jgi:regulator of protease activity HflC (stomatin/prohibitin superfamily)
MKLHKIIATAVVLVLGVAVMWLAFEWMVNRIYVPEGKSLMLRYKGPLLFGKREAAQPGQFAKPGQIGVLEQLRGPGRHFYCPIWWERTIVDDVVIQPGEVGVVTSRMGQELKQDDLLVDGDLATPKFKGVLRRVLSPGRYRLNPYAFKVDTVKTISKNEKYSGWVEIPSGYVGVVTYLADNPEEKKTKGIQNSVLPPGLYPINPREQQIDVVGIGFSETSIEVETLTDAAGQVVHDESGEPLAKSKSGISFPSDDAFDIQIDFTAVWGIMPDQASDIVRMFGNLDAVEQKVILPQSESICRNLGSKMGAVELLVGETRQAFQDETSAAFQDVLEEKHVTLLYGLVRHTYIPQEVRFPIQEGYIADEQKLTREQEQLTAKAEAKLREAEQKVQLETETIKAETAKLVANVAAEGEKQAQETAAETKQLVAVIDKKIAELEAQKTVKLGEATAKAEQVQAEARAAKFGLAVEAFGTPAAYNKWEFAEGLPASIDLQLFYAGEGTLWTDLKGAVPTVPLRPETPAPSAKPVRQ